MKFSKQSLSEIPHEDAHGGSGSRQMLLDGSLDLSPNWEAVTKGFLPAGQMFDWHEHKDIDEMWIVTKGEGKFYCEDQQTDYKAGDVITVIANTQHKIVADTDSEGFFIRVK